MSTHPSVFTEDEVNAFLSYIGLSPTLHQQRYTGDVQKDIHFLTQLVIHTISTIPYENLSIHYSPTHTVTIVPRDSYAKIVLRACGRGGYCMENSLLFNHILCDLNFPVYTAPCRPRTRVNGIPQGDYHGQQHLVNIVTLSDGGRWMIDVGFGGDGAITPIPLVDCTGTERTYLNLGTQENRLVRDWIPAQAHRTEGSKLWIYQYRNGPEKDWNAFYAFAEVEAMENDFKVANRFTGSNPESFQTWTVIAVKFLRREKEDGSGDAEIHGKRILFNEVVKENLGGKTRVVKECKTDTERVQALEDWFGLRLTPEEASAIKGWNTAIGGDGTRIRSGAQSYDHDVWGRR
ncbi:hypothetical protein DOTSEDRAFT_56541 [Dothistroma septosporum NZE10]|uniref:Uncharacterized protein n=1 Tax=Dothistroma septosporum (strain NZE10 / CBS 128990) TaxID=675120 RepID=N1PD99_DOTSN|nr:hypothetical protein DOTSEDRAFT_56541 [Dothistroma septosporum NZE10]